MKWWLGIALATVASVANADLYLLKTGEKTWIEITSLAELPAGKATVLRVGTPPDPGDPDPPPAGLVGEVAAAVKAANDPANAAALRGMYEIGISLLDRGSTLLLVKTFLLDGETKIIDSPQEKTQWVTFSRITQRELSRSPLTKQTIVDISTGFKSGNLK